MCVSCSLHHPRPHHTPQPLSELCPAVEVGVLRAEEGGLFPAAEVESDLIWFDYVSYIREQTSSARSPNEQINKVCMGGAG